MLAQTVTQSIDEASYGQFENGLVLHIILSAVNQLHYCSIVDQCAIPFQTLGWIIEPSCPVLEGCGIIRPGHEPVRHPFDFLIFNKDATLTSCSERELANKPLDPSQSYQLSNTRCLCHD